MCAFLLAFMVRCACAWLCCFRFLCVCYVVNFECVLFGVVFLCGLSSSVRCVCVIFVCVVCWLVIVAACYVSAYVAWIARCVLRVVSSVWWCWVSVACCVFGLVFGLMFCAWCVCAYIVVLVRVRCRLCLLQGALRVLFGGVFGCRVLRRVYCVLRVCALLLRVDWC